MSETQLLPIRQNTGLVTFTLIVNGSDLPQSIAVRSVSVYREINRIPTARIILADGDGATGTWNNSSGDFFIPGNEIEIQAGYHSENETIFKGIIIKQNIRLRRLNLELDIECKDAVFKMALDRKSRQFEDKKDSEIIETILSEYNLKGDVEASSVKHAKMIQYSCSDWDFVISRLDANGLVAVVQDGSLNCIKPELASSPEATLRLGQNLIQFDTGIDARAQPQKIVARAWDPVNQEIAEAEAADPGWATPGNLKPEDLASAAGAASFELVHSGRLNPEELQAWADASLLRRRLAFLRGKAQVQGFSTALPGMTVALEGLGDRFNGSVLVSGVRHELTRGAWLTDLQIGLTEHTHIEQHPVQAPSAGMLLPAISGLHIGVVTQLAGDPEGENRVRIKIPTVDPNDEGTWARLATLDAGDTRGTFFLPEIGDEVVVGFLEDDPRHPVVLGMLHSSAKSAPLSAADENHEKGYQSRSGIKFIFNDDKKTVKLETPGGNSILLDDDKSKIEIADQNGNTITLSSDGITLKSAKKLVLKSASDFKIEGGANVEAKAGAQFVAEGTAGMEVKSGAVTVVKGALVQIN